MNRFLTLCLAVAASGYSGMATAQDKTGFELGFRTGYAIPLGEVSDENNDNDLNDAVSGQVPLWFDLGGRVTPNIFVGAYVQYGFAFIADEAEDFFCPDTDVPGVDTGCSAGDIRVGAQIHYHFLPEDGVDPWIGYGIGYEWLKLRRTVSGRALGGQNVDLKGVVTARGAEFANFQAGVDFAVTDSFGLGPFLSFSLDQFSRASISVRCDPNSACNEQDDSEAIDDKALHHWLFFGVRGTFVL